MQPRRHLLPRVAISLGAVVVLALLIGLAFNGSAGFATGIGARIHAFPSVVAESHAPVGVLAACTPVCLYSTAHASTLSFKEVGLPLGATWTVLVGVPGTLLTNTTNSRGGVVSLPESSGTVTFVITAPSGYGVAHVNGRPGTTFSSTVVSGASGKTVVLVKFGALERVTFSELGIGIQWNWSVTLTPANNQSPPGLTKTNGTTCYTCTIGFKLPAGAHFKYRVAKPAVFRGLQKGTGAFVVPDHAYSRALRFETVFVKVDVVEQGLPAGTLWAVTACNSTYRTCALGGGGSTIRISFPLVNGTWTLSFDDFANLTASPVAPILVVWPQVQTVFVTFS